MKTQSHTRCEEWELTRPALPPRSRLYPIEPIGVGTPMVESLTGYLARLAEVHGVKLRTLVEQEIVPLRALRNTASSSLEAQSQKMLVRGYQGFCSTAAMSNGVRTVAQDLVNILEALTGRPELRYLTMLPWSGVLSPMRLLRKSRAWCPACYEEWRLAQSQAEDSAHLVPYEPLLWTLQVVKVCARHLIVLQERCPKCGKSLTPFDIRMRPGHCYKCGAWLGVPTEQCTSIYAELNWKEVKPALWLAGVTGELLAIAPGLSPAPDITQIAAVLRRLSHHLTEGKLSTLSRSLKLLPNALRHVCSHQKALGIDVLLHICYQLGADPVQFLFDESLGEQLKTQHALTVQAISRIRKEAKRRNFDIERVRGALELVLNDGTGAPTSLREIASCLGCNRILLHRYFPDLCRAIAAQNRHYNSIRQEAKLNLIVEEVCAVTRQLWLEGSYPSGRQVAIRLGKPSWWRIPRVYDAWRITLTELGL